MDKITHYLSVGSKSLALAKQVAESNCFNKLIAYDEKKDNVWTFFKKESETSNA